MYGYPGILCYFDSANTDDLLMFNLFAESKPVGRGYEAVGKNTWMLLKTIGTLWITFSMICDSCCQQNIQASSPHGQKSSHEASVFFGANPLLVASSPKKLLWPRKIWWENIRLGIASPNPMWDFEGSINSNQFAGIHQNDVGSLWHF